MELLTSSDVAKQGLCELLPLIFVVQGFIFHDSV